MLLNRNNLIIIGLIWCSACTSTRKEEVREETTFIGGVEPGWNIIPAPVSTCSDGSPYYFFYRPGNSEKLAIFLQGGGATWNYFNSTEQPSFKKDIDTTRVNDQPQAWRGLFNLESERNFMREYSILVVPYCTGDVMLGNADREYKDSNSDSTRVIFHNGYNNSMDALDWVFSFTRSPTDIFLFGTSAGSVATPVYAATLATEYPEARIVAFGDSSGAYMSDSIPGILSNWGADQIIELNLESSTPEIDLYFIFEAAAKKHPDIEFLAYNAINDRVQAGFLQLMGEDPQVVDDNLQRVMEQLEKRLPNFAYYLDTGTHHGIAQTSRFYTTTNQGIPLHEWLSNYMATGEVESVNCCGE